MTVQHYLVIIFMAVGLLMLIGVFFVPCNELKKKQQRYVMYGKSDYFIKLPGKGYRHVSRFEKQLLDAQALRNFTEDCRRLNLTLPPKL